MAKGLSHEELFQVWSSSSDNGRDQELSYRRIVRWAFSSKYFPKFLYVSSVKVCNYVHLDLHLVLWYSTWSFNNFKLNPIHFNCLSEENTKDNSLKTFNLRLGAAKRPCRQRSFSLFPWKGICHRKSSFCWICLAFEETPCFWGKKNFNLKILHTFSQVGEQCSIIWHKFMGCQAEHPVNVDSTSYKITQENMNCPDR